MHEGRDDMAYAIVDFIERDEVGIVPCSWIHNNSCKWPNHPSHIVDKMVKKASPPGDICDDLEIQVKGLFTSWNDARKMLPRAEYHSDLNDGPFPSKRIRRARVIDTDEEDDEDQFPRVPDNFGRATPRPGTQCSTTKLPQRNGGSQHAGRQVAKHPAVEPSLHRTNVNISYAGGESPPRSGSTEPLICESQPFVLSSGVPSESSRRTCELDEGLYMQTPAGTTAEGGSSKHMTRGHQALPYYEFQQQVLKSLNILRLGMQQQSELLSSLVPLQTSLT
ncbi:uncharacterized protein LOC135374030 [Ornithodoros turicata]|uniref:uncharacterized protein LOC135374030 n=1 Tax=Ornithodoros turicata TaxID=34597 RepID=UPI00313A0B73